MVNEQLPDKISELVDILRSQDHGASSLTDVASVTEVLIATMQAFFRSIDASIYNECRSLSDYISSARMEIAALTPKDLENARIPRAGLELDAIVQQTEEATNTIMTSAEDILTALGGDLEENKDSIEAAVMQIFEACSFQDITGQRISKVVHTLTHIEQRISDLKDVMGVTEDHIDAAAPDEDINAVHSTDSLAQGPSLKGEGIDQSAVDALIDGEVEECAESPETEEAADDVAAAATEGKAEGQEAAEAAEAAEAPEAAEAAEADAAETAEPGAEADVAVVVEADPKTKAVPAETPAASPTTDTEDDESDSGRTTSQEEIDALFG